MLAHSFLVGAPMNNTLVLFCMANLRGATVYHAALLPP